MFYMHVNGRVESVLRSLLGTSGTITYCVDSATSDLRVFGKTSLMTKLNAAERAARRAHDARVISVRGAREHNLKNVDIDLPRDSLIVMTGLSGSGKSSLAFDTIYAEGQRRYVESLSAYARQFLEMMQKPDVDQIDGLSPAISIEQKTTSKNPRSTVATVTEIYDYMRLLFARVGVPYSPATGLPIESQTVSQMVDRVMALEEGTRLYLLAPIVRGRKGEYRKELAELRRRALPASRSTERSTKFPKSLPSTRNTPMTSTSWWTASWCATTFRRGLRILLETALRLTDGMAVAELADKALPPEETQKGGSKNKSRNETHERLIFSEKFACPVSGFTIPEIEPRLFSFNNPFGACPACDGLGTQQKIDENLVVPDEDLTLTKGAIAPWSKSSSPSPYYAQTLKALGKVFEFKLTDTLEGHFRRGQNGHSVRHGQEACHLHL